MRWARRLAGLIGGLVLLLLRFTCRYRVVDDPRPALRSARQAYIYALLHAHQAAAVCANDDAAMTAMVSRSTDGDLLVPALALRRVTAVRGSSRKAGRDKGGRRALQQQADYLAVGVPALLAVDGPRGPRGSVRRGVADLAFQTQCPVLPVIVLASRRWILPRTWDRLQIPKPFAAITLCFGPPLCPSSFADPVAMAARIEQELRSLESLHDPAEAAAASFTGSADRSTPHESTA